MADEALVQKLKTLSADDWRQWKRNATGLDFRDADLRGADLSGRVLTSANLSGADLTGCDCSAANFANATITESTLLEEAKTLKAASFNGCNLQRVKFPRSLVDVKFSGADLQELDFNAAELTGADFSGASVLKCGFNSAYLGETSFSNTKLDTCDLQGANLFRSNFAPSVLHRTDLRGAKHLFGPDRSRAQVPAPDAHLAIYSGKHDVISWFRLRTIHSLRMFGVSYSALLVITLYVLLASWYNNGHANIQEWVAQTAATEGSEVYGWLAGIPQIELPLSLAHQFVGLVLLAAASTIYAMACPDIVSLYTESAWEREHNQSLVEYRSANWASPWLRYCTLALYTAGLLLTAWHWVPRLWDVGWKLIFAALPGGSDLTP